MWHRLYGIPFGEDFFWQPHLLMYFGFLAVAALGFAGLYIIARQLHGTFQHRFRASPLIGLLVLVAAFLLYVLPADPIWHAIYGADLTAWSIPHVLLILNFTTIMLVAVAIQLSLVPVRAWCSLARITVYDVLPLLMFACVILINLQLFTTEYDQAHSFATPLLRARPAWVLPFLVGAVASFAGMLANHSLRSFGAATVAGLAALGLRYALIQTFDARQARRMGPGYARAADDPFPRQLPLEPRHPANSSGNRLPSQAAPSDQRRASANAAAPCATARAVSG